MEDKELTLKTLTTENHGAHSGIHSESSEYHDGGNLTHYFGNDEYLDRFIEKASEEKDGAVAYGNQDD